MDKQIKLVVSDLDGTLLGPDHKLSARTVATVQKLVERGYQFMLATGRHYQDVYLIAQQLGVEMNLITSNGARVHSHCGEVLFEDHMPKHLVEQVLAISSGYEVHRNIYQGDLWLVEEPHEALLAIHHASGFEYEIIEFAKTDLDYVDKIYFTAAHERLLELESKLKNQLAGQLHITFTSPEYLEIMNKGVSKGHALHIIKQRRGIDPSQVLALGDGMNDKEMLTVAGHGVVMANASDAVKQALPGLPIAKSNAEDGVADYLETYLLKG